MLEAGDIVEMAGDYYTGRGSKRPDRRRYVLVVRVEPGFFIGAYLGDSAPSKTSIEAARAAYLFGAIASKGVAA